MFLKSVYTGIKKGIKTTWTLGKVVVPVYIVVTFLKHTPVIDWIANLFAPVMGIFNLPGEAVIALVIGNLLNMYAGVGALKAISLTPIQVTTLAVMLGFSHSLLVETAIAKKLGANVFTIVGVRITLGIVSGIIVGQVGGLLC
ncbi:nucleoside recognition protein [Lutibacter sp. B2]|nr:nucleoside recognition protein [Lutibacter sp. B2]